MVIVAGGELCIRMEFNNREAVVRAIKDYSISKLVDYKEFELEPTTFYCKCKHFGRGCEWLVRASLRKKKDVWEIRKYNGPYTCAVMIISQDHSKLDTNIIA